MIKHIIRNRADISSLTVFFICFFFLSHKMRVKWTVFFIAFGHFHYQMHKVQWILASLFIFRCCSVANSIWHESQFSKRMSLFYWINAIKMRSSSASLMKILIEHWTMKIQWNQCYGLAKNQEEKPQFFSFT